MVAFLEWLKANKHPVYRLDPLDEVGEVRGSGSRFLIRQTWQVILLFCLPLFIWTSVATIKDVAHVTGQVMPSGAMQAVQHMEGGIVAEVLVHESQLVDKGQVLLRLDSRQAMPEREQAEVRLAGLQARSARLQAIVDDTEPDYQRISQCFKELVEIQKRIYADQMATFQSNRAMVEAQIAQRNSELQQTIGDLA
ncbi:MAG: biotin/lipoyl-binding protein, partial [Magnetococcales bacterium]|nr:biotin/lipoyl-binding protein [Magnetococcales bacterium]